MPFELDMTRAEKVSGIVRTADETAALSREAVRVGRDTGCAQGIAEGVRTRSAKVLSEHASPASGPSKGPRQVRRAAKATPAWDARRGAHVSAPVRTGAASVLADARGHAVDAAFDEVASSDELEGFAQTRSAVRSARSAKHLALRAKSAFDRGIRASTLKAGASQAAAASAGSASAPVASASSGVAASAGGAAASSGGGGAAVAAGGAAVPVLIVLASILALMILVAVLDGGEDEMVPGLSENESIVANLLREAGFDDIHIAAIMGNWACESDNNPRQVQHGFGYCNDLDGNGVDDCAEQDDYPPELIGNPRAGYGLAQWTYPARSRALVEFAAACGSHSGQADVQVAFFCSEFSGSMERFCAIDDLEAATRWFHEVYEISGDSEERIAARVSAAERIYAALTHSGASGYVAAAKSIADDDSHGYSMERRAMNPDVDCSSYVYYSLIGAGWSASELGGGYPFTTYNMGPILESAGFEHLPFEGVDALAPGDILVNPVSHTEIYYGEGMCLGAHMDYDRMPGDSSGREVCLGAFWDAGYTDVYRRAA